MKKDRNSAFTLVEIMIVVAIIALLAAIAIPNFMQARAASIRASCVANLKQMNGAKATWALESKKTGVDVPTDADLFGPARYVRAKPECPAGGIYPLGAVGETVHCSLAASDGHTL